MRKLSTLWTSESGATALEFAMLAPFLILILVVGMIMGHAMLLEAWLDDAVIEASRYGATGQSTSGPNDTAHRLADIETTIAAIGGGVFSTVNTNGTPTTQLSIVPYADFASLPANLSTACPAPGQASSSADPGGSRQIVVYCLTYSNDNFVNQFISSLLISGFNMQLSSTALVVNEPF